MNLDDEQRKVGIENFHAAVGNKETRAALLRQTVAEGLSSGKGLGAKYFSYGKVDRPVRIGVIGTGDEGGVLIGVLNLTYVQVVAIADIRPYNVYRAFHGDKSSAGALRNRPGLMQKYGWPDEETAREKVKVYEDGYEDLLDDANVEAVIIALPLHLHAEASIKAMRKGKHVLCEKLMAHSVHQCKEMARVSDKENRLLAVGHQRHYSVLYDCAVELIKQNLIGDVHHVRAQWHRANLPEKDSWQPPLPTDPQLKKQLEQAEEDLGRAKRDFEKVRASARSKIKDQKTDDLLNKFDGELISKPKRVLELKEKLAELSRQESPDEELRKKYFKEIGEIQERLRKVNKTYLKKLKLDPRVARKFNIDALSDQVEILTHRIKDAQIETTVKNYGYRDQIVGPNKISALEELIRWRLWDRTGGGLMAELGSHQLDASGIFISALRKDGKKVHPLSVTAVGGRHIFPHNRDIDDHVYCSFEYPGPKYDPVKAPEKKIVVSYSSINGNGFGGYGETVLGTKGTLILDGEKEGLLFYKADTARYTRAAGKSPKLKLVEDKPGSPEAGLSRAGLRAPISRGYCEEIEHWAWAIRQYDGGDKHISNSLRCRPDVALADAVIALTTNLAIEAGKRGENCRIDFKPEWFDVASDETPEGEEPNVDRPEYG